MRLAWAVFAATIVLLVVVAALSIANDFGLANDWGTGAAGIVGGVASVAFGFSGALIATRRRRDAVGWICLTIGVGIGVSGLFAQLAYFTVFTQPGALGDGAFFSWFNNWDYHWFVALLAIYLPLLFPSGRLPGSRWRVVAWLGGGATIVLSVCTALRPGQLASPTGLQNPFGVDAEKLLMAGETVAALTYAATIVAAGISMVVRFRRSSGLEREQLKWFAFAVAAVVLTFVPINAVASGDDASRIGADLTIVAFTGLPLAIGLAILRYRLYDIDVVINRTVVYLTLTAILAVVYVGGVLLLQLALSPSSDLAIAGSTLAVAALFRPLRARVQSVVDRRFFRRRYDAQATLQAFATRLRDQVDLAALSAELGGVVADTMQPAHVSLWLRERQS